MRIHVAIALIAIVMALLALVSLSEHKAQSAPLVQAKVSSIPPSSHFLWKQRRIA